MPGTAGQRGWWRLSIFYSLLASGSVAAFLAIRAVGERLPRPEPTLASATASTNPASTESPSRTRNADPLPRLLMALAAVILIGRILAGLLEWVGQPPVIGEVLAGIALGPSLLGWICRDGFGLTTSPLMPPEVAPYLGVIAQLGVI